jgi:hypothetical protein
MHLKLTINGTAFTVATVRIVGKPEIEKSSQLPWANFLLARHPTATQWTKLREQHMPGPSASLVWVQYR